MIGIVDTTLVSPLMVVRGKIALSIGEAGLFTKTALHCAHERAWARIGFGCVPLQAPEYEI